MKIVTFKTLKIRNFLSIGTEPVVIDFRKGIHVITGINSDKEDRRNGVGKSTIADAFYFALFGTTLREIKKEYICNNIIDETTVVQLTFNVNSVRGNDDFEIIRSINPSRLTIHKNGIDKTRDSIANTSEYINAVLSTTPEIFHNTVLLTMNNAQPFMSKTKAEKRKFIEQIFNLQVFSQMMSLLRDDLSTANKSYDLENAKKSEIEHSVKLHQQQVEKAKAEREEKKRSIEKKIETNNEYILTLQKQKQVIPGDDIEKTKQWLTKLQTARDLLIGKQKSNIEALTQHKTLRKVKIAALEKMGTKEEVCPVCLRPMDQQSVSHIEDEKGKMQQNISLLDEEIKKCTSTGDQYQTKLAEVTSAINRANEDIDNIRRVEMHNINIDNKIKTTDELSKQLYENLTELNTTLETGNVVTSDLELRLATVNEKAESLKRSINLLDVVKFVVSEEGVKSFIVNKILHNFNSRLAFYLKKLDSNSICIFNEYFEEEILNEKGKMCSYNNFSGAERKAIDLACLFAFMDTRKSQGDVHYNVSFYDELLDSSLDEKGINIVIDILKERSEKYTEGIYIISHRKESVNQVTGEVIYLEKRNGITKRVPYTEDI